MLLPLFSAFGQGTPSNLLPDLSYFKLTFPLDDSGDDYAGVAWADRNSPLIKAWERENLVGWSPSSPYSQYFFVSGNEVVFRAHCAGALTSANSYPRCELRETPNGTNDLWLFSDEHELNATFRVTNLPNEKEEVCMLQIKGNDSNNTSGTEEAFRLEYRQDGDQGVHVTINETLTIPDIMDYSVGQTIESRMYVNNGNVTIELNNTAVSGSRGEWNYSYSSNYSHGYFKAGCYTQSSIWEEKNGVADESPNAFGEVRFSALSMGGTPPGAGLPAPWSNDDIGNVAATGDASYSNGTFTVEGSGADIWGTADEFHFVHQSLSGSNSQEVTVTARVVSVENTNAWAKAGVMIRDDFNATSKHAMTVITPSKGISFQRRLSNAASSGHTTNSGYTAPYWVRIKKSGNTFTSYRSSNGSNWTTVGSQTFSMGTAIYVGLVVTSHADGNLCTATFDNVSVVLGAGGASCTSGDNLAENETIASYSNQQSANPASNILDGNTSNRWSADGFPQNAVIDLGAAYSVNEIKFHPYQNRAYQFLVEGSATSATSGFNTLTDARNNTSGGSIISRTFNAQTVRYVRVTVTGASGYSGSWSSVKEFEVICAGSNFGSPSTTSTSQTIDTPKGLDLSTNIEINYHPNPFQGEVMVKLNYEDLPKISSIRMVDVLGKVVAEEKSLTTNNRLNVNPSLAKGLYLIQVVGKDGAFMDSYKVIKN